MRSRKDQTIFTSPCRSSVSMATACLLSGTRCGVRFWSLGVRILRLAEVRVRLEYPHGIVNINFRPAGISEFTGGIKTSKFSITASRVTGWPL